MSWFSEPIRFSVENRCRAAWSVLIASLIGWPATHILMVVTDPVENTWVFHVLLAISWFAITATAVDILVSTHAGVNAEEASGGDGGDQTR